MSEAKIVADARIALSCGSSRVFRNNVGKLQDRNGTWVTYGLCVGSSDLIGFRSITITPDMVGDKVAVFCALEAKHKSAATVEQLAFLKMVSTHGGYAGIFHDTREARQILRLE